MQRVIRRICNAWLSQVATCCSWVGNASNRLIFKRKVSFFGVRRIVQNSVENDPEIASTLNGLYFFDVGDDISTLEPLQEMGIGTNTHIRIVPTFFNVEPNNNRFVAKKISNILTRHRIQHEVSYSEYGWLAIYIPSRPPW